MNEMTFTAGWNARVANAQTKLPRQCKKNEAFIDGFRACDNAFMDAIAFAIRNFQNPVYPKAI